MGSNPATPTNFKIFFLKTLKSSVLFIFVLLICASCNKKLDFSSRKYLHFHGSEHNETNEESGKQSSIVILQKHEKKNLFASDSFPISASLKGSTEITIKKVNRLKNLISSEVVFSGDTAHDSIPLKYKGVLARYPGTTSFLSACIAFVTGLLIPTTAGVLLAIFLAIAAFVYGIKGFNSNSLWQKVQGILGFILGAVYLIAISLLVLFFIFRLI